MKTRQETRNKILSAKFSNLPDAQKEYFLHLLKSKDERLVIDLIKQEMTVFQIFLFFGVSEYRVKSLVSKILNRFNQVRDSQKLTEFKNKLKMIMFPEKLKVNEKINEGHFFGKFMFPHDLDFLGCSTDCQVFVDWFNEMIEKR